MIFSEWKTPDLFDPVYELATTWSSRTFVLLNKDGNSPPPLLLYCLILGLNFH